MSDKAWFIVRSGTMAFIETEPIERGTQVFHYTQEDYEYDQANEPKEGVESRFETTMRLAQEYAKSQMNPKVYDWVRLEFVWL